MTTRFDTTAYEFSHGRKPRGTGLWAFKNKYRNDPPVFAPRTMPLGEAKRWARRTLVPTDAPRPSNILVLEVMP